MPRAYPGRAPARVAARALIEIGQLLHLDHLDSPERSGEARLAAPLSFRAEVSDDVGSRLRSAVNSLGAVKATA